MSVFLTFLHVIVCFILIAVILLQAGRGQGLTGAAFGSGNVQSLFGTRAADFLTKATSVTAICFLFTSLGLDFIEVQKSRSLVEASRQTQSVGVDAIRKALEKVKEEGETALSDEEMPESGELAAVAEDAVQSVSDEVESVASDEAIQETIEEATGEASDFLPADPETL